MSVILNENVNLTTAISYQVRRNGELLEITDENQLHLITDGGRYKICEMMKGEQVGRHFKYLGIGTSSELPMPSDSTLENLILIPFKSVTISGLTVRCEFLISRQMANGFNIKELGLFFDDETLFCRHVRGEQYNLVKAPDIEIEGFYEIDF